MELTDRHRSMIDEHCREFRAGHDLPGVVLGLTIGSELVHVAAAAADGQPEPRADTRFRIASMTKSFTAAAVLVLRDRGLLSLDDPARVHVPELSTLVGPTADAPPVTIRHLLSMSSGLAGDDPWADRLLDAGQSTMDALFAGGATFALTPGTGFVYSNLGYAMLGRVITNAAGRAFQDVITTELLAPLGMRATGWQPPEPSAPVAMPLWRIDGDLVTEPVLADGGFASMGGLWSTLADLARWCGWLLDAFPARDGPDDPILRRASRRELQQVTTAGAPRIGDGPDGTRVLAGGYGYGLNVAVDSHLGAMVHHSGGLPGYGSNMRWLPERNVAAIALANHRYAPARELTLSVLDLLQADGVLLRPAQPPTSPAVRAAAEALVDLLNEWTGAAADRLFSANVDLDERLERRRAAAVQRREQYGPLTLTGMTPLNRAEADVEVSDDRGLPMTLEIMLSPEPEVRIQWFELEAPRQPPLSLGGELPG